MDEHGAPLSGHDPEEFRQRIARFLQGDSDILDGAPGIVIGFGLVVEILGDGGTRGVAVITSDASGKELPWYVVSGYAKALEDEVEFDHATRDES